MTDVSQYLIYMPTKKILVCGSCQYGLQPKGVERHLRRSHKEIPLAVRNTLVTYSKTLILEKPSMTANPTDIVLGFDCLELIEGHRCLTCGELHSTSESMKKHCNQKHEWTERQGYPVIVLY